MQISRNWFQHFLRSTYCGIQTIHIPQRTYQPDSLVALHNGMMFTTKDEDNDKSSRYGNCAVTYKGAWWYKDCHESNLNGHYLRGSYTASYANGVNWFSCRGYRYSLKKTEMKISPPSF